MQKSKADKARIKRQKLRSAKREAALHVKKHKTAVGSNAYKASLEGFKAKGARLPRYFNEVINNARKLIYSRKLEVDEGGISRAMSERTKRKLFEIVVTMITTCDLLTGQVGMAKNFGFDTTSHDALMLAHAKRWGEAIPSSTWYRYIDMLKKLGVFTVQEVKIAVEDNSAAGEEKTIRSVAAYKWLSSRFLQAIGAYSDTIRAQIKQAYQRAISKGLSFTWRVYKRQLPTQQRFTPDLFFSQSHLSPKTH
ncbi:hypothetical protein HT094_22600 [Shewanella sp. ZOR0012]|uniref:hypothetical protein n=1 Tax=Shewanella sp. ZOR0012 TaxID=1339231 RepID=UPI000648F63C|nr:hypothetical protein [Shewanella sp. ZOR0012]NSM26891.1 hypothetical protein [Shewanella sp. ZOR0012]